MLADDDTGGRVDAAGFAPPFRVQVDHAPAWTEASAVVDCPTVRAALEHVVGVFEAFFLAFAARVWASRGGGDVVQVYRRADRSVVVVGRNALADRVRAALPANGWNISALPMSETPLSTLREAVGERTLSMLRREGFTTVEEVAAVPDSGLLDLRNMGLTTLGTLRMAIAAQRLDTGGEPVTLSGYHVTELRMLLKRLASQAKPDKKADLMREVTAFLNEAFPSPGSACRSSPDPARAARDGGHDLRLRFR
jgi:hypothetical protein